MKLAKILVNAILIPAVMVVSGQGASDSVQKLLRKPRYGRAQISLADGTEAAGVVNRVTSQFLSLRDVDTCRNVELAQIASIKWLPKPGDSMSVGDTVTLIAMVVIASPVLIPLYIVELIGHRDESSHLDGNWESISTSPDGKISRIEGNYRDGFMQRVIAVATGRYEIIGQNLHLVYDGSGLIEDVPLQFECESLLLGAQKMRAQYPTTSAQAPIVGRWHPDGRDDTWEFTASGTFVKKIAEWHIQGQIKKIKGGIHVKWLGPDAKPDEEWGIRTKAHHLFITAGGATTEYVRVDNTRTFSQ